MKYTLTEVLSGWSSEELSNLSALLDIDEGSNTDQIIERIRQLYHPVRTTVDKLRSILGSQDDQSRKKDLFPVPTYNDLIVGISKQLKVFEETASLSEQELFITHAVIIASLQHMKPYERKKFFEQQIDVTEVADRTHISGPNVRGPATTFALLGMAQASGFGVYIASTTALGFLTQAIGVTLPFVAYTGLTSTISFLIGPVGWLGAGLWGGWKLIQSNWKKLLPAIVCIIATNRRRSLE